MKSHQRLLLKGFDGDRLDVLVAEGLEENSGRLEFPHERQKPATGEALTLPDNTGAAPHRDLENILGKIDRDDEARHANLGLRRHPDLRTPLLTGTEEAVRLFLFEERRTGLSRSDCGLSSECALGAAGNDGRCRAGTLALVIRDILMMLVLLQLPGARAGV